MLSTTPRRHVIALALLVVTRSWAIPGADELPFKPLPRQAPAPKDNPTTPARISLGRQLFFDARLSKDGTVSCNSCHSVMGSGTDNRSVSVGVGGKEGGRNSPTVWNSAFHSVQFWDGRAKDLEAQAKGPLVNPVEMAMDNHEMVVDRLKQIPEYVSRFDKAFGGKDSVTIDNAARAIAAYERTLVTPNSPFDRFLRGDSKALSAPARKGFTLVQDLGCVACHHGIAFNGPEEPGSGEGFYQKFPTFTDNAFVEKYQLMKDTGRHAHTGDENDKHYWRVPTWRNIALTAPYFHNGSVKTLDEAVRVMVKTQLNKSLTEDQVKDVVAFLTSLTGEIPKQPMPELPQTPGRTLLVH